MSPHSRLVAVLAVTLFGCSHGGAGANDAAAVEGSVEAAAGDRPMEDAAGLDAVAETSPDASSDAAAEDLEASVGSDASEGDGSCSNACPVPRYGRAVCDDAQCGIACDPGYHDCGGVCADDFALGSCGTSCSPCATRANEVASCDGQSCSYACTPNRGDCDGDPTNGCEVDMLTDGNNCGS